MKLVQAKMHAAKRLRAQIHQAEVSVLALDDNIDAIINSDIQRDIIGGLKWSTEAVRGYMEPMGGVEGVSETVSDLQTELDNAKQISDALFEMPMMTNIMGGGDSNRDDKGLDMEASLLQELNTLLQDEDEEPLDIILPNVPSCFPSVASTTGTTTGTAAAAATTAANGKGKKDRRIHRMHNAEEEEEEDDDDDEGEGEDAVELKTMEKKKPSRMTTLHKRQVSSFFSPSSSSSLSSSSTLSSSAATSSSAAAAQSDYSSYSQGGGGGGGGAETQAMLRLGF
jgi:hypothetical protein